MELRDLGLRGAVSAVIGAAHDDLAEYGVPEEARHCLADLYLVEMFLRVCRLKRGGGWWSDRFHPHDRRTGSDGAVTVKALLVCSTGGHLTQLHRLRPWYEQHERHWVTFEKADAESLLAGEEVTWAYHPTTRNVRNLMRNLWLAVKLVSRYRPDVVVTTGAGVAYPFFLLGRLYGARTVYLEVYDRIDSGTLTGSSAIRWRTSSCCSGPSSSAVTRRASSWGSSCEHPGLRHRRHRPPSFRSADGLA
ncbi:hypothetical protein ACFQX6_37870 [Streptosporangium lutulentum]